MKEIENDKGDKLILKKARLERKETREKALIIPDVSTADYERQLRKLATRGGKR